MDVYIEDVFFDNFLIDFIILFLTSKLLCLNTKFWHIALCACFGVSLAFLNLLFPLNGISLLLYKFLSGALISLSLVPKAQPKKYFLTYVTFLFITFLIGGACLAISVTFGQIMQTNGSVTYSLALPVGVVLAIVFLLAWLVIMLINAIKNKLANSNFCAWVAEITLGTKHIKTKAFLDTGNTLCDPTNSQPILFLSYKFFRKICNVPIHQILLHKTIENLPNCHYISVGTVAGRTTKILVFSVNTIVLKQPKQNLKITNPMVGLTFSNLEKKLDAGLLLNPKVLNGGYCEQIS